MLDEILESVSKDTKLPLEVVKEAYYSFWRFARETIQALPLKEDLTEEEFNSLQTNINVPSLGKLYCDYSKYLKTKKRFELISKIHDYNNKEN